MSKDNQKHFSFISKKVEYFPLKFDIPTGDIIGWKKVKRKGLPAIVQLLIPVEAKRVHKNGQRKCRAEFAKVISVEVEGKYIDSVTNYNFKQVVEYKTGEMVYPDKFDDSQNECSNGINFFLNKIEAVRY